MAETSIAVKMERSIDRIRKVCEKVERAQDSYKSIMVDVYFLHKNKAHKEHGYGNFYEFMKEQTGMGNTTAKSLVKIGKYIEDNDGGDASALMSQSMRDILTIVEAGLPLLGDMETLKEKSKSVLENRNKIGRKGSKEDSAVDVESTEVRDEGVEYTEVVGDAESTLDDVPSGEIYQFKFDNVGAMSNALIELMEELGVNYSDLSELFLTINVRHI